MRRTFALVIMMVVSVSMMQAQKEAALYLLCGKTGNCGMSWDDFMKCKKELVPAEKGITVGSFLLTIQKSQGKKDTISIEYPSKGNLFSKSALESIEKLHKDKKMGNKVMID